MKNYMDINVKIIVMFVFWIIVLFNRRRYVQIVIRFVVLDFVMKDIRVGKMEKMEDMYYVIFFINVCFVRRLYYDVRRNLKIISVDIIFVSFVDSMQIWIIYVLLENIQLIRI